MKENLPKIYLDFIEECKSKDYSELFTHKHHIIPKFMGGTNESDNLIVLSVEDHFLAHKILAENCDNNYKAGASASLNILYKHWNKAVGGDYSEIRELVSKSLSGSRNGMYGKTHKPEIIESIKKKLRGSSNPMRNPENRQKVRLSKLGVSRNDMNGGNNKQAKKCIDLETGIVYGCIKDMANGVGVPRTTMNRWIKDERNERFKYISYE